MFATLQPQGTIAGMAIIKCDDVEVLVLLFKQFMVKYVKMQMSFQVYGA